MTTIVIKPSVWSLNWTHKAIPTDTANMNNTAKVGTSLNWTICFGAAYTRFRCGSTIQRNKSKVKTSELEQRDQLIKMFGTCKLFNKDHRSLISFNTK